MDMKISGAGAIGGGEYDKVAISGSAKAEGFIRCKELHCSGAFSGNAEIECENDIKISGAFKNAGAVKTKEFKTSGSAKTGAISAETIKVAGAFKVEGNLKTTELDVAALDRECHIVLVVENTNQYIRRLLAAVEYELHIRSHSDKLVRLPTLCQLVDIRVAAVHLNFVEVGGCEQAEQVVIVSETKVCRGAVLALDCEVGILDDIIHKNIHRSEVLA